LAGEPSPEKAQRNGLAIDPTHGGDARITGLHRRIVRELPFLCVIVVPRCLNRRDAFAVIWRFSRKGALTRVYHTAGDCAFLEPPMTFLDKPENRRRHARVRPSGLVSKTGTIIVDPKRPGITCTIIDLSASGACIDVSDPGRLPKRFVLLHGATRKSCLIVWRKFRTIGVLF
jgi:hypothetical protein